MVLKYKLQPWVFPLNQFTNFQSNKTVSNENEHF